jgi:CxxC motif-containing protein (DUF1111 family)
VVSSVGTAAFIALSSSVALAGADDLALQPTTGDPLRGLTAEQLAQFDAGKVLFGTPILVEDGLGPIFNKSNCRSCHTNPDGGPGSIAVTHFGILDDKGEFEVLPGGSLFQLAAIAAGCEETIPDEANLVVNRATPGMMGFGLVEAIPDDQIAALEDPTDADGDGISGRVHWVTAAEDPTDQLRAGRFGWKSIVPTVMTFTGDASKNELGLTNALFDEENAPNGDIERRDMCDDVPEPEDQPDAEGFTFVDRVTQFQRFLAAPPQTPKSGMTGETIAGSIGCLACHHGGTYTLPDDPTLEDAIRGKTVKPYSDFLLHDVGLLGDGLPQGDALGNEFRTTPLMGMRDRDLFIHDGRVASGTFEDLVRACIAAHGPYGEGAVSAAAFDALADDDQTALIAFLDSLGRREFDYDGDKDVDFDDYVVFLDCYYTDNVIHPDDLCAIGDIDQNGSADSTDFAFFIEAYDGIDLDCDCDGMSNLAEIAAGAPDMNADGVPDDCTPCLADLNCDLLVTGADLGLLLAQFGACTDCRADINNDGIVSGADLGLMLASWGPCN